MTRKPRRRSNAASGMPELSSLEPQLATLIEAPPTGSGYVYEIKFDGYRALSSIREGAVHIRSRNDLDWTGTFPAIAARLAEFKAREAILDGEICFIDAQGRSSFSGLQGVMGTRGHKKVASDASLIYYVFDLLWLDGKDLRSEPLLARKQLLARLMKGVNSSSVVQYSAHSSGDLRSNLAQACSLGLEGLIVKQADAHYEEARSRSWLKLKCGKRQEFVIVGFIEPQGARRGFRSLLLGLREQGRLRYAGKVGTGFNEQMLKDIAALLEPLVTDHAPVSDPPREKGLRWVQPRLVCEVSFTEMTRDGSLRHPSFQGLRQDKRPRSVTRERAVSVRKTTAATAETAGPPVLDGITITHPDRVVDESSGTTKGALARYYEQVADLFLTYATDRPMALVRCPQGGAHQCFFQKNAMPGLGRDVQRGTAAGHGILSIRSAKGIYALVQFNAMEFHGWGAAKPSLKKPDWIIFDLDPDDTVAFPAVVESALEIRDALKGMGLESFVKTTGGKGLHVTVPIIPRQGWDAVKSFTRRIAESLEAQRPERYVATMAKAKRKGKIFIDYLRNGEGATAVLPYSSRARPGATVAVPVAWKDLAKVDPREFRVDNVGQWLGKRRRDPWAAFTSTRQELPELA